MSSIQDDDCEPSGYRGHHHDAGEYIALEKDPGGRDDEKDEEYGKDSAKQGNEEDSLCRSSDDIEDEYDEQWRHDNDDDDDDEENDKEGEGLLGTKYGFSWGEEEDDKQAGFSWGEEEDDKQAGFVYRGLHSRSIGEQGRKRTKDLLKNSPPALPSLARTLNLPCHMPCVHLRSNKSGGRLAIEEFKIHHHQLFHAVRSDGRLILHLVKHDADLPCLPHLTSAHLQRHIYSNRNG